MSNTKKPEDLANDYSESQIKRYGYAGHSQRVEAYLAGHREATSGLPVWREIQPQLYYNSHLCKNGSDVFIKIGKGATLLSDGYTHYLSSEDLLKLPVEKK